MNNIIKIGDKDYPFHFGMRTLFNYCMEKGIEFDEITFEGYGDYMELFSFAVKSAIDRGSKGEPIDPDALEDKLNRHPKAFAEILRAFNNSEFKKAVEESNMLEEETEKKPSKSPTKKKKG